MITVCYLTIGYSRSELISPLVDNPDTAEHNERHKQDQLQKQKDGKGHWKPELASNSEEAVSYPEQERNWRRK